MATTFETAAVISLIDHLSAPLRNLSGKVASELGGHEATMNRFSDRMLEHSRKLSAMGQHMTYQMTAPILAELKTLADHSLEFSKVENNMRGILETRDRAMKNLTGTTREFSAAQVEAVKRAGELAYQNAENPALHGLANPLQYREAAMAAIKAGYTETDTNDPATSVRASTAIANQAVNLALSNGVGIKEAADNLINVAQMFNAETKNKDGSPKSQDQMNAVFGRFSDLMAWTQGNTRWSQEEVMASYQRSAPFASQTGMAPETLAVISEVLADKFSGSVTSTAERGLFQGMLSPRSQAASTLAANGIDIGNFTDKGKGFDAEHFEKFMRDNNYKVAASSARAAFAHLAEGNEDYGFNELTRDLAAQVSRVGSSKNPVSPNQARKQVTDFLSANMKAVDATSLLLAEREANNGEGMTYGALKKLYEPRLLSTLMAGVVKKPTTGPDLFAMNYDRMYGNGAYAEDAAKTHAGKRVEQRQSLDQGAAARRAAEHSEDLQGAYLKVENAYSHMVQKLSDGHAFTQSAEGIATLMDKISDVSPKTAAWGVDIALAAAALGPVLWTLGQLGTAAVAAGRSAVFGAELLARIPAAFSRMGTAASVSEGVVREALSGMERAASNLPQAIKVEEAAMRAAANAAAEAASSEAGRVAAAMAEEAHAAVEPLRKAFQVALGESVSAGADLAEATARLGEFGPAARDAAALADTAMENLTRNVADHVAKVGLRLGDVGAQLFAKAEQSALASGDLLTNLKPISADMQAAYNVAADSARMARNAAELAQGPVKELNLLANVEKDALSAAAEAAGKLEDAVKRASEAMLDAARKTGATKAYEAGDAAAKAAGQGLEGASKVGSRAATEQAAILADQAAKQSEKATVDAAAATARRQSLERAAEYAADTAERAAARAAAWRTAGRVLGAASGVGEVLTDLSMGIDVATQKKIKDHLANMPGQGAGVASPGMSAADVAHLRQDIIREGYNPFIADGYFSKQQERRGQDERKEFLGGDAEAVRGRNRAGNEAIKVSGDVKGTVENTTTIGITVNPSPMLQAVIDRAQQVIRSDATLLGKLGEDMPPNYGVHAPTNGAGHM